MKGLFFCAILFSSAQYAKSTCLDTGKFPNNAEPDCRGFTMCLKGAAGFIQYSLVCPENSIFSHIDSQCSNITEYKCLPNYNCSQVDNIPQPQNECTTYISCIIDLNNVFSARLITCPVNTVFNGSLCVEKDLYLCPFLHQQTTEKPNAIDVVINNFEANATISAAVTLLSSHFLYCVILASCCYSIMKL
ncbi:unnamed protein product [Leptosia nina]|uniref:Chitin-binding type-2 domain-containing protein n=1 Tax=Leptosia nina TaxID=320188 RepID=A0AAV1JRI9_9NEOP